MATEAHKFEVGTFVIVATLLGIGGAVWLGASRFFEKTEHYVTYFSESVQGLDPGAAVKYRGVPAGRVDTIEIAPDGELIEVRMNIDDETSKALKQDPTLRATLELSGITGLRYIEIDRRSGDALHQAPTLSFKPPCEVIPSCRSSFKAIQSALGDVYDQFMKLDLPEISVETRNVLQAANQLLRDERIDAVLTNFKAVTQSANALAKNLETMTAGVKLAPAVENATQASAEAKALFTNLNTGPTGQDIGEAVLQVNRLAQNSQQVVLALQYTIERLQRTVSNLEGFTEEVKNQPSLLLFAEPPVLPSPAAQGGKP